jgi:23S rRNA (cytosine1962-C5)-methyltransferase
MDGKPPRAEGLYEEVMRRYGFAPRGYLGRQLVIRASDQKPGVLLAGGDPGEIVVRENGLAYLVEPAAGYSSGLFLDQRVNRSWVAGLGAKRMLNLFAYTCSFTVCAAAAGGETCSVDSAQSALRRGRANLAANGIDPADGHRFLVDDATKVVPRLVRRGERFDLIVLDPPTFGRAAGSVFRLEKGLPNLVSQCFELLEPRGSLLVSCNFSPWGEKDLQNLCRKAVGDGLCAMERGERPPEIRRGAVSCRIRKER